MIASPDQFVVLLVFVRAPIGSIERSRAQAVPIDAAGGRATAPATVDNLFEGGKAPLNTVASPADSTVMLTPNCLFFRWSEQMFLLLTSPAPAC